MGVIHKLKHDVIDFIVQQKKESPSLGCRRLSEMVTEKFQTKISKSSINNVLKSAHLSSSVGRKSGSVPTGRKFMLPKEKRLNAPELPVLLETDTVSQRDAVRQSNQQLESAGEQVIVDALKTESAEDHAAGEVFSNGGLCEDMSGINTKAVDCKNSKIENNCSDDDSFGRLYDNVGLMVFKSLQWEMFENGLPFKMIRESIDPSILTSLGLTLDDGYLERLIDYIFDLCLLEMIDVPQEVSVPCFFRQNQTLPKQEDVAGLLKWFSNNKPSESLWCRIEQAVSQSALRILGFKVILEDNSEVILDAQLKGVWCDAIDNVWATPIKNAIALLSKSIISNLGSCNFSLINNEIAKKQGLISLMEAFNCVSGKGINKIVLFDEKYELVVDFSIIPKKKRSFSLAISSNYAGFQEISNSTKWVEKMELSLFGDKVRFYYSRINAQSFLGRLLNTEDGNRDSLKMELMAYPVWCGDQESPTVIILSNSNESSEKIVVDYLRRWPGCILWPEERFAAVKLYENRKVAQETFLKRPENYLMIFEYVKSAIGEEIENFAKQQIKENGEINCIATISRQKGEIQHYENFVKYQIKPSDSGISAETLYAITYNINQRYIIDPDGRRVIFV